MTGAATSAKSGLAPYAPGPQSLALFEEEAGYLTPGLQSIALFSRLAMDRGEGATLFDMDGRRYVDFAAGVGVASVGHAHPRYARILAEQVARLTVGSFTTPHRLEFLKLFAKNAPNSVAVALRKSGFTSYSYWSS